MRYREVAVGRRVGAVDDDNSEVVAEGRNMDWCNNGDTRMEAASIDVMELSLRKRASVEIDRGVVVLADDELVVDEAGDEDEEVDGGGEGE